MKLSLTIEGSPSVIAAVLAALPQDAGVVTMSDAQREGGGRPTTTQFPPFSGAMPVPPAADDDDGAPADPNAPAVDSSGLPWDERIHSSSRKIKADGTWTKRKNVAADLVAQVEAELRGGGALPQPVPMSMPQPMPTAPMGTAPMPQPMPMPMPEPVVQQPMAPVGQMPSPPVMPQPMPMPAVQPEPAPVQQPQPVAADTNSFQGFMAHLVQQMNAKDGNGQPVVHADYLASVVQRVNTAYNLDPSQALDAITALEQRPEYIPYTIQVIQADGRW